MTFRHYLWTALALALLFSAVRVFAAPSSRFELEILPSVFQSACSDGIDNDNDGRTDFGSDPGCVAGNDMDENDAPSGTIVSEHGVWQLRGWSTPGQEVRVFVDGQYETSVTSKSNGSFTLGPRTSVPGSYTVGIQGTDGQESTPLTTTGLTLKDSESVNAGPVVLPPTIYVALQEGIWILRGWTVPYSRVLISISAASGDARLIDTTTDASGFYEARWASRVEGNEYVFANTHIQGLISPDSYRLELEPDAEGCLKRADINGDCKVDLIDYSIAAYWHTKELPPALREREAAVLNNDAAITLHDFSIIAYYWAP